MQSGRNRNNRNHPPRDEEKHWPENQVEGKNPVLEALRAGRTIDKILIAQGGGDSIIAGIIRKAREKDIVIQEVNRHKLDNISSSGVHQGIIAFVTPYSYVEVDDILNKAQELDEDPFILILDEITDPQNFGAILRSAEGFGVHGVIIPKRRSVGLTPTVIKASAGAVEYMSVAKVTNLTATIEMLKEKGLWIAGADAAGTVYTKQDLKGPLALVIGSEGKGISRLVKKKCDFLVGIPLKGKIESLNASVATAIIMAEIVRQRG